MNQEGQCFLEKTAHMPQEHSLISVGSVKQHNFLFGLFCLILVFFLGGERKSLLAVPLNTNF